MAETVLELAFICVFRHFESKFFITELHVLSGDETIEEDIDSFTNRERHSDNAIYTGLSVKAADKVGQVVQNGQVVLNNDDIVGDAQEGANGPGSVETLFDVQVGGGLIEHVNVSLRNANQRNCHTLQLTTRKLVHRTPTQMLQVKHFGKVAEQVVSNRYNFQVLRAIFYCQGKITASAYFWVSV